MYATIKMFVQNMTCIQTKFTNWTNMHILELESVMKVELFAERIQNFLQA